MLVPGVDYPLYQDYDDGLLYEFHLAGILIEKEIAAQRFAKECNEKTLAAKVSGKKFKLFPPLRLESELVPVNTDT